MIFTIVLAGFSFRIESLYDEVYRLCTDYLVPDQEPDFTVSISPADIRAERLRSIRQDMAEGRAPSIYPDAYLETLAVYRRIADTLPAQGVFLLHGSAVAVGGRSWVFTAPSGTGKTTHTKLWLEHVGGSFVVNGDKPLIRRRDGAFEVCGTPWAGKEGWNRNTAVPLGGIVFLSRGERNRIEKISDAGILTPLIGQTYRPSQADALKKTMELLKALYNEVPFFKLSCNMEPDAALTAFKCLSSE